MIAYICLIIFTHRFNNFLCYLSLSILNGDFLMLEKIIKKIAPCFMAAGIFLMGCPPPVPIPIPTPTPVPVLVEVKNPVILAIDDFQASWLDNIQDYIVQKHSDNNIPVTLAVIPQGIEPSFGAGGTALISRIVRWNANPNTEVAQHGYDHLVNLGGETYDSQYTQIKKGKDLMNSIGIYPESFVPPFSSADDNTIKVVGDLGFHTLYGLISVVPVPVAKPLLINDEIALCVNFGVGETAVFKDYAALASEIEPMIKKDGVALVLYHMQDFEKGTDDIDTDKGNQIIDYANHLKRDGYTLMTVEQYYNLVKK